MNKSIKAESKLLFRHSIIYGFGNVLNLVAGFALIPVYTRFLNPHDYGIKELVTLSTDVISIFIATAISSAFFRFYFEYEESKDRNEVVSTSIIILSVCGLAAFVILSLFSPFMASTILDNQSLYYFFLISFASMWFNALNNIGMIYLRAKMKSISYVFFTFFKLCLAISMNIFFVCFLKIGVLGILISNLIAATVIFVVLVVPIFIDVGIQFSKLKLIEMLKFGFPMVLSQLGGSIVHISDRFFIKGLLSIGDAGLYSLGYRFGTLPTAFVTNPFNQVWLPRRLELYKQSDSELLFGKIFTYFVCLLVFIGLFISLLTKEALILVSDPQFYDAYKVVPIIVLSTIVFSLHYHFNFGIYINKKTKLLAYINISNGILVLILNYFLIARYGIYGAAFATLLAFIFKVLLTYILSNRYYKIHFEFTRIFKIAFSALLTFITGMQFDFFSVLTNLSLKFFVILIFPILLYVMKFYTYQEKQFISDFWYKVWQRVKQRIRKNRTII